MSLLSRIVFALWYLRRPPWDSGITPPELLDFLKDLPAGRAIDLGCGTGTNAITMARMGWKVTGVDFTSSAIAKARRKVSQAGVIVDLRVGDVTRVDGIEGPFDFTLDLGCFHSLSTEEKAAYQQQLARLLKPGGFWFMYAFLPPEGVTGPGVYPQDLMRIGTRFRLVSQSKGFNRGDRPSSYFIFEKLLNGG
jgi:SAM-dependent methyltransferase